MTKRKTKQCAASRCDKVPYAGGLCKEHYEAQASRRHRENAAVEFLHSKLIDGQLVQHPELREEFQELSKWWDCVCRVVQTRRDSSNLPVDEADYAISWCTSIAQRIMEAELSFRAGIEIAPMLKAEREPFWERFRNIEAGLSSNGTRRRSSN